VSSSKNFLTCGGFVLFLACCPMAVMAQTQKCIQERTETRLDTLQVNTCLLGAIDDPKKPPLTTVVLQTLKNRSNKPIELELFNDVILRVGASISSADGREVSKRPQPCVPDDTSCKESGWGHQVLAPGQQLEYRYRIADLMEEAPRSGVSYSMGVNASYAYRFLDEPKDQGYRLRNRDENSRHVRVQRPFFEGLRLR
jgi:hypothetical protein